MSAAECHALSGNLLAVACVIVCAFVTGAAEAARAADPPVILRGTTPGETATPDKEPAPTRDIKLVGGEVLWIVDDQGNVTACRLRATTQNNRDRIECRSRRLD